MNKINKLTVSLFALLIVALIGAFFYKKNILEKKKPEVTKASSSVTITIEPNTWKFSPDVIYVPIHKTVTFTIDNQDSYDHGFDIPVLSVNSQLPGNKKTIVTTSFDHAGSYDFNCSVPCGAGHYHMVGKIIAVE